MLCDFFKPRPRLEAEILILRHQLNVLQQRTPRRRLPVIEVRGGACEIDSQQPQPHDQMKLGKPRRRPKRPKPKKAAPKRD
jgi:hypothetical protein